MFEDQTLAIPRPFFGEFFYLHVRTTIRDITVTFETGRTGDGNVDQQRHDSREILFKFNSHGLANLRPCCDEMHIQHCITRVIFK